MSTMENNFEPMTTGMVLDKACRLYINNFVLMIGLSAILNIPLLVFNFLSASIRPTNANILGVLIGLVAFLFVMLIIGTFISGAITMAVSDIYLGNIVTAGAALSAAWRKGWTLLKTQIVVGLIVWVGLLLMFVPGILWSLSYILVAPVVMIEGLKKGREIRHRSWGLVKGNRGKVFLVFVVILVIQILVQAGVGLMTTVSFGVGNGAYISSILDGLVSILLSPVSAIAVTLLYYDFRIRKEGFDLEMLSRSIGGPATEA